MQSKAPGGKTVPRAEIWGLYILLLCWTGLYLLEIMTDASYTIKGMGSYGQARRKLLRGKNDDLWKLIYQELNEKELRPTLINVKSHLSDRQHFFRQAPLWQVILNELADDAASKATEHQGRRDTGTRKDRMPTSTKSYYGQSVGGSPTLKRPSEETQKIRRS